LARIEIVEPIAFNDFLRASDSMFNKRYRPLQPTNYLSENANSSHELIYTSGKIQGQLSAKKWPQFINFSKQDQEKNERNWRKNNGALMTVRHNNEQG